MPQSVNTYQIFCLPEKQYILYFDGKQIPVFERACEITLLLKSVLLPGQN